MTWNFSKSQVYGIYGELGGGKTLTAVDMMVSALDQGHKVISNILLRNLSSKQQANYTFVEDLFTFDPWQFPQGAPRGSSSPARALVVLDEISESFDQYSGQASKNFLSWLRHSSKRGQSVIMISQRPEFMAKPLRLLVSIWIVCIDLAHWRIPLLKIHLPFMSGYVGRNLYDRNGNLISTGFNLANKKLVGYYYDTAQSIALAGRDSNFVEVPPYLHPRYKALFVVVAVWLFLALFIFGW